MALYGIPEGLAPEVDPLDTAKPIGSALTGACERLYKFRDWVNPEKLNIYMLCQNPSPGAVEYIEQNLDKMDNLNYWSSLCLNSNYSAIDLLERNFDKIYWEKLCFNRCPRAINLLRKNLDKVVWYCLCNNDAPEAIALIRENIDKIDCLNISNNKSPLVAKILEEHPEFFERLNYPALYSNNADWALDLLEKYLEEEVFFDKYWEYLSKNTSPRAIAILEKNFDKIHWLQLSANKCDKALDLLEKNKDKIDWNMLMRYNTNHRAIKLIEENIDLRIDWNELCHNSSALHLFEKLEDKNKLNYHSLSDNPVIFELNKKYLKEKMDIIREEICIKVFHPRFVDRLWTFDDYLH